MEPYSLLVGMQKMQLLRGQFGMSFKIQTQSEHMNWQFYVLGVFSRHKTNIHTRLIDRFLNK